MRKFLIPLLMAGVMMPAAAMAQDRDHQRDRGDEQRAEHRAERAESRASNDRPQRQERAERPQREQIVSRPERTQSAQQQPRFERHERRADQVQQVEQVRQLEPVRQVQGEPVRVRREGGFLGGVREAARQQQVLQAQPATRDNYRDGSRNDHHDGYRGGHYDRNRHWSSHWRTDNRYDWQRYRDRNRSIFRLGSYYDPYGWGYRRFSIGFNIGSGYYGSNYWLDDPWMYRLPPAYGPYRWVRYYDDALLVNIYSGQVVDVINNFFW